MAPLPQWPPALTDAQQADLAHQAATYALAHGFTLLPIPPAGQSVPAIPTSVIAAPLSLLPTPFPRPAYVQAKSIQRLYNALYARVALDWEFIDRVMEKVAPVDEFQAELWGRWKAIREEIKVTQVSWALGRSCCVARRGRCPPCCDCPLTFAWSYPPAACPRASHSMVAGLRILAHARAPRSHGAHTSPSNSASSAPTTSCTRPRTRKARKRTSSRSSSTPSPRRSGR